MYRTTIQITVIILLAILTACSTPEATPTQAPTAEPEETTTLSMTGSGSVTPVLAAIADAFESDNPNYELDVLPGSGTGGGVRGVIDGTIELAAMSRAPRDTEAEDGVAFELIGNSVTAIMAHPDVTVPSLTSEQLTDIFTGEITNWSEIGGDDLEIVVYIRDPEEGNTVDIRETFIGDGEFVDTAQLMLSQTDMQNIVSSVEGAIGYGTWAAALANDADVISLTVDDITVDNAPDTMVTMVGIGFLEDNRELVQPLIDWLQSDAGQTALEAVGAALLETETES